MNARTNLGVLGAAGLALALGGCDLGPKNSTQHGPRGAGLQTVIDTSLIKTAAAIPPEPYAASPDEGERASKTYQNVQVLGYASTDDFNRIMAAMNEWIGTGEQGCNYCHNPENMASDEKYTKVVARRMLQMTQNINNNWTAHVQNVGVTCWTCHRGNAVPVYNWNYGPVPHDPTKIRGNNHGQNMAAPEVQYASLPNQYNARYLAADPQQIRVASASPYPNANRTAIQGAEGTYGLMIHMSHSLGVNCTYCHNTQSFRAWNLSSPQRSNAWYGIRMVRDLNVNYIGSLAHVFPAYRKGPQGDPAKANCGTCHQGQAKPMNGYPMINDYPVLRGPRTGPPLAVPVSAPIARPGDGGVPGTPPVKVPAFADSTRIASR